MLFMPRMSGRARLLSAIAVLAAAAATRWPFAPKYLYSFDQVNFALALRHFDPALHQPQPPGYPLFVGFIRLLHLLVPQPEIVLPMAGIVATAVAVLVLWWLADEMFGAGAGIGAGLLLLFHPVCWFGALTNPVRVFLAVFAPLAALFAWRAWQPGATSKWFFFAAFTAGIGSGFRPGLAIYLAPLLLALAYRRRESRDEWAIAAAAFAAGIASWLGVLLYIAGGPLKLWAMVAEYSQTQFSGSSVLFGAEPVPAWRMAQAAFVWTLLGVPAWIWAVALPGRRHLVVELRRTLPFLLLWFVPAFLFFALVHVGDPDHTLVIVPVTCLIGGAALAAVARQRGSREAWAGAMAISVLLSVILFVRPASGLHRASSLRHIRSFDRQITSSIERIRTVRAAGPVYLVAFESFLNWRQLTYYFPNEPVLVIDAPGPPLEQRLRCVRGLVAVSAEMSGGSILIPAEGKIVLLVHPQQHVTGPFGRRTGPLIDLDVGGGTTFTLDDLNFKVKLP
jgi:hypothetical protein